MAVQNAGLGKGPDPAMQDQTSYDARKGAAKKPQTNFPVHPGMTDQQKAMAGVSPSDPGSGPDASGPSPLDPTKVEKRIDKVTQTPWGQKDAYGRGLDTSIGGKVIGEAILSGSAKLPDSEAYSNSKPERQPG